MEEYLRILAEQMRCKKAREAVCEEIRTHIEEQAEEFQQQGMTKEKAMEAAIKDMGDPVETGIALDGVHRPQMAWGMILFMTVIGLVSILLHTAIGLQNENLGEAYILRQAGTVIIGILAMLAVCRLDYSVVAKYAKLIASAFILLQWGMLICRGFLTNGAEGEIMLAAQLRKGTIPFFYLYVPVYGAVIYRYHGEGKKGVLKSLLWLVLPLLPCRKYAGVSTEILLLFQMLCLLSIAVQMDWFTVRKKALLQSMCWGMTLLLPILLPIGGGILLLLKGAPNYQIERIHAFVTNTSSDYTYISDVLLKILQNSHFIGKGDFPMEIAEELPGCNSDYILMFLGGTYGVFAIVILAIGLLFLIMRIFRISFRQKNQLGKIMGCGCGLVFLVLTAFNYMQNLTLLPTASSVLPFFSANGMGTVVFYILMGIVLSIYRYKSVLPGGFGVCRSMQ